MEGADDDVSFLQGGQGEYDGMASFFDSDGDDEPPAPARSAAARKAKPAGGAGEGLFFDSLASVKSFPPAKGAGGGAGRAKSFADLKQFNLDDSDDDEPPPAASAGASGRASVGSGDSAPIASPSVVLSHGYSGDTDTAGTRPTDTAGKSPPEVRAAAATADAAPEDTPSQVLTMEVEEEEGGGAEGGAAVSADAAAKEGEGSDGEVSQSTADTDPSEATAPDVERGDPSSAAESRRVQQVQRPAPARVEAPAVPPWKAPAAVAPPRLSAPARPKVAPAKSLGPHRDLVQPLPAAEQPSSRAPQMASMGGKGLRAAPTPTPSPLGGNRPPPTFVFTPPHEALTGSAKKAKGAVAKRPAAGGSRPVSPRPLPPVGNGARSTPALRSPAPTISPISGLVAPASPCPPHDGTPATDVIGSESQRTSGAGGSTHRAETSTPPHNSESQRSTVVGVDTQPTEWTLLANIETQNTEVVAGNTQRTEDAELAQATSQAHHMGSISETQDEGALAIGAGPGPAGIPLTEDRGGYGMALSDAGDRLLSQTHQPLSGDELAAHELLKSIQTQMDEEDEMSAHIRRLETLALEVKKMTAQAMESQVEAAINNARCLMIFSPVDQYKFHTAKRKAEEYLDAHMQAVE